MRRSWLIYAVVYSFFVSTLAMGEVRKMTREDMEIGDPTTTVTSPGGHIGHRISNTITQPTVIDVRDYGAVGNGTTDDTSDIMDAMTAAYNAGGGRVVFEPGKTYIVQGLWPLDNVILDLSGATLKLKPSATQGIIDMWDNTYCPDNSARTDSYSYMPDIVGYQWSTFPAIGTGFYAMTTGTKAAGTSTVTLSTAADAGNFSEGDLAIVMSGSDTHSQRVVESIEILSASGSTGVLIFKWPLQKYHKDTGTYFGVAKRDAGYISGRGFKLMNGTLDAGSNTTETLISYDGMDMDFIDLTYKGDAEYFHHIRGTNCRLIRPRMYVKGTDNFLFAVDMGATNNTVSDGKFFSESPGLLHNGEGHSGTKFLHNTFAWPARTTAGGSSQYNGTTGMTFIGNTFYNYPGIVVGGGSFPDNTPHTQVWIGNEFYGQFTGALLFLTERTGTPDPTLGQVIFANNTAIGTLNTSLVAGASPYVIRSLYNATVSGNYIRIVDSSSGAINLTDPSLIGIDTVVLKDNIGLPDIKRRTFTVDDFAGFYESAARLVAFPNASSQGFPVMSTDPDADNNVPGGGYVTWAPAATSAGGKVGLYGKAIWVNLGAGAGDIYQYYEYWMGKNGTALDNTAVGNGDAFTMGAQGVPVSTGYFSIAVNGMTGYDFDFLSFHYKRSGEVASDTLTNDAGMMSLELILLPMSGY